MYKNLNDISENLYILLLSLNRHIFNPNDLTKKLNLPHSHIKVLFYLVHNGPTSISKMASDLCISRPNMTPVIDKLVEDELVSRDYNPNDRRVILIKHTDKGLKFLKEGRECIKDVILEKISLLTEDDINTLSSSINNLTSIIKKF